VVEMKSARSLEDSEGCDGAGEVSRALPRDGFMWWRRKRGRERERLGLEN